LKFTRRAFGKLRAVLFFSAPRPTSPVIPSP
jgi:hypothetical protein